nr:FlgO family outer membrane protein [Alteromonas sp. C1M14]
MQLLDSARELDAKHLIGIASFVRLNTSLQETTVLGNQLSELLIAQMQSYGLGVVDFKMAGDIIVTPKGDLAMRRSNGREAKKLAMDHILTGTLIEEPRGVRVNARIVSTANYQVVASTSLLIPAFIVTQLNHAMVGSTASTPVTVGF